LQQVIDSHDNKDGRRTIDQLKDFGWVILQVAFVLIS
jgi:hypothetical protein